MRKRARKRSGPAPWAATVATGAPWSGKPRTLLTCQTHCRFLAYTAQPVAAAQPLSIRTAMASPPQGAWPGPCGPTSPHWMGMMVMTRATW